ncbi:MAG TPA: L,D-transpeptidase [Dictyobacter sp.]|nr:L,D-transpeptidase [Dictyobacter sp.]
MYQEQSRKTNKKFLSLLFCGLTLCVLLGACSSQTTTTSTQAQGPIATPSPSVSSTLKNQGSDQLQTLQKYIAQMQEYGGNVATYQTDYTTDEKAFQSANTTEQYTAALDKTSSQVNAIKLPAIKAEATSLYNKLASEDASFGKSHTFYDSYNNTTYQMGYEYNDQNGILGQLWGGSDLDDAQTVADYQYVIEEVNMWSYNFQEMVKNASDKTPATQAHATDLQLMQHYGATSGLAVVVSLYEQEARIYDNGKLIKAFQVTTGQPDLVSPPGDWHIEDKEYNVVFKSSAPVGSPDWYPNTPIANAMMYHSNGYFLHTAWWRDEFGPGTQFPHQDPSNLEDSGVGSHGCINMSTTDAAWLEGQVQLFTPVIVY